MGVLGELLAARSDKAERPPDRSTTTVIPMSEVARAQSPLPELPYLDAVARCLNGRSARLRRAFEAFSRTAGRAGWPGALSSGTILASGSRWSSSVGSSASDSVQRRCA